MGHVEDVFHEVCPPDNIDPRQKSKPTSPNFKMALSVHITLRKKKQREHISVAVDQRPYLVTESMMVMQ